MARRVADPMAPVPALAPVMATAMEMAAPARVMGKGTAIEKEPDPEQDQEWVTA